MYKVKTEGLGKLVCNQDGCTPLTDSLSQRKLKRLFTLNCEFIEYVEEEQPRKRKAKASRPKASTTDKESTECEEIEDTSSESSGRKSDSGERTS